MCSVLSIMRSVILNPITVKEVRRYPIALPYKTPFRTSYGEQTHKIAVIVEVITTDDVHGWGEASLETVPRYGYETIPTALHMLDEFLIPLVQGLTFNHPAEIAQLFTQINGHPFTKAGLDAALWDAFAKTNEMSLLDAFRDYLDEKEAPQSTIKNGVVVGIQLTTGAMLHIVQQRIQEGYRTFKLKVSPQQGIGLLKPIRTQFPDIQILVDANGAYTAKDTAHLRELDTLGLLMIEQPFPARDLIAHQQIRTQLQTPVCLDESITNLADAQLAHQLKSTDILNIKPARVGGFTEALKIYQFAWKDHLQMRVGGMLETGIGRASILQFAALTGFTLPADISATNRYFTEDITRSFELNEDGTLTPPDGHGIGAEVNRAVLTKFLLGENQFGSQYYETGDSLL